MESLKRRFWGLYWYNFFSRAWSVFCVCNVMWKVAGMLTNTSPPLQLLKVDSTIALIIKVKHWMQSFLKIIDSFVNWWMCMYGVTLIILPMIGEFAVVIPQIKIAFLVQQYQCQCWWWCHPIMPPLFDPFLDASWL